MHLQHELRGTRRLAIALEPPGNLSRELSLYRRKVFRELGDPSSLAFPDLAFLSWSLPSRERRASGGSPGGQGRALGACWTGIEGSFASSGLASRAGAVFIELRGALSVLSGKAAAAAAELGLEADPDPAIEPGVGFFVIGCAEPRTLIDRLEDLGPPAISFLDCSLALIRLDLGDDPMRAASWRVLARSIRRTGP